MTYYEDWTPDDIAELEAAGAQFTGDPGDEGRVPLSGLNVAMQTVEGAHDEETGTGFTATGTGSFLATVNEDYRRESERRGSGAFERFKAQFELTDALHPKGAGYVIRNGRVTNFTPWQLFNMERGVGDDAGAWWSSEDDTDEARYGTSPYTDPSDYTTSTEFLTLKDGFLSELTRIGLDTDTINELWTWVEGRFVSDASFTTAQAQIEMYDQKAFKDRFPGITAMREETGRRDIPTPGEYLARERLWATYLGEYGMTALGADLNTMVAESYINAIGEGEFVDRLTAAREMIYEAPAAVKNTFGDWFGNHADAALMAVFLDPSKEIFNDDWVGLKGDVAAAEVGGWSKMHLGLDAPVTQVRSRAISKLGWRDIDVWDTLDLLKAKEDLFVERIGEVDYQMEVEGVAAEFGINTEDLSGVELAELLDRRGARRTADFSGGGGAMLTGTTTGFGAANA